jgi:hypothetical protein
VQRQHASDLTQALGMSPCQIRSASSIRVPPGSGPGNGYFRPRAPMSMRPPPSAADITCTKPCCSVRCTPPSKGRRSPSRSAATA